MAFRKSKVKEQPVCILTQRSFFNKSYSIIPMNINSMSSSVKLSGTFVAFCSYYYSVQYLLRQMSLAP